MRFGFFFWFWRFFLGGGVGFRVRFPGGFQWVFFCWFLGLEQQVFRAGFGGGKFCLVGFRV